VLPHERKPWDIPLARLALGHGSGFVAQTERERSRLQDLLPGVDASVSPLPPYTLDSSSLAQPEARRRLDLPPDRPVLLFFGIVRPYKGLRVLIDALAELPRVPQPPLLVVAGEFWEDIAGYRQRIARLGLETQVRIVDRYLSDDEAALYFAAADCLIAPYTGGTQSAVASLAIGSGLPLIVTDQVAPGLGPPGQALVVPAGSSTELAAAIGAFLNRLAPGSQSEARLSAGRPDAAGRDGWDRLVDTLETLAGESLP
jgi:glycosyltransferase involved in cell wall biosynthesis